MRAQKRGCFTRKTYDNYLYTWCPEKNVTKNVGGSIGNKKSQRFCNATANSNGEDWNCTYVYNLVVDIAEPKRLAYVACDYVK